VLCFIGLKRLDNFRLIASLEERRMVSNPQRILDNSIVFFLSEHTHEGLIILDDSYKIVLFNPVAEKIFHCNPSEVIGFSFDSLCSKTSVNCFSKQDWHHFLASKMIKAVPNPLESIRLTWLIERVKLNSINYTVMVTNDYETKNKQNEIFQLETLIENMPCNVYWMDSDCRMAGCNQNVLSMLNMTHEQFKGKTYEELSNLCNWPEGLAKKLKNDDLHVLKTGNPIFGIEDPPIPQASDTVLNFLTSRVPLSNNEGKVIGVAGISVDITALKEAREAAEAANKAKSEFIANMSHDLRLPLTGILGLTEGLIDVADNTLVSLQQAPSTHSREIVAKYQTLLKQLIDVVQEDGQLVLGSADELLQLLNEILETMRLESGKVSEKAESFDLRELVNHNIELMQAVASHRGLELISEIDEHIPRYFGGFRNYLDRTLLNLLSNGLKFTKKGFVKLKVELPAEHNKVYYPGDKVELKITVQDTGIGIPKDKFKTIFEHFSRLTPSYQGIYKGAGLGLYTVNRYIEAMEATIDVESEVGKGTSFIIKTPLTVSDHSDREKSFYRAPKPKTVPMMQPDTADKLRYLAAKEDKTEEAVATIKILIVEDNPIAAKSVQGTITRSYSHCVCDKVVNGKQAVKKAEENRYDFILMDIGLPDIDGIEVTKQIRAFKNPQIAQVPIVALTGHASNKEMKEEALAAGMQDVFAKPLNSATLESLMQQYVFKPEEKIASVKETESQKIHAHERAEIIDWPKCLEQLDGDEKCLHELLAELVIDLKMSQEKLAKSYAAHDVLALRAELHRVRGGLAYLSLPQLDQAFAEFHEAVKAIPQNPKQLKKLYSQLQHAMTAFWKYTEEMKL
jgi:two-component system, OmpR family, aerobic respiration control sensor histidine kinase ArcB